MNKPLFYIISFGAWLSLVVMLYLNTVKNQTTLEQKLQQRCQDLAITLESMAPQLLRFPSHRHEIIDKALQRLIQLGQFKTLGMFNESGEEVILAGEALPPGRQEPAPEKTTFLKKQQKMILWIPLDIKFNTHEGSQHLKNKHRKIKEFSQRFEGRQPLKWLDRKTSATPTQEAELQNGFQKNDTRKSSPQKKFHRKNGERTKAERMKPLGRDVSHLLAVVSTEAIDRQKNELWTTFVVLSALSAAIVMILNLWFSKHLKNKQLLWNIHQQEETNALLAEKNMAAAGLAHETRTPLSILRGHAQMLSQNKKLEPEDRNTCEWMVEEVDRITSRLNDFIKYSRLPSPKNEDLDLCHLIHDQMRIFKFDLEDDNITWKLESPQKELWIHVDPDQFRQVLFNLIHNAIQISPEGSQLDFVIQCDKSQQLSLKFMDQGPGIPEEQLRDIFQPYKSFRKGGTGLGLAISRQICSSHNLTLTASNRADRTGACFEIAGLTMLKPNV